MSMRYLGVIRGTGRLTGSDGRGFGPADYDVDGYLMNTGKIVASGELRMPAEALTLPSAATICASSPRTGVC